MIDAIDAIRSQILNLGLQCFWSDVDSKPNYPYVVLWSRLLQPGESLNQQLGVLDVLRVTCVALRPSGALKCAEQVRSVLKGAKIATPGIAIQIGHFLTDANGVDQTITLPNSDQHPAYVVDSYDLMIERS